MMELNSIWFLLVGVLLTGYAILDGFDLGAGVIALFGRDERERGLCMSAIGPVWNGNEVWLITGGGALFAAFPVVYATVFEGFYLAFMLLLVALILRGVALEFRGQVDSAPWRRVWDVAFGVGSLLAAVLFGVAYGNILLGLPLDERRAFAGSFLGLLNPYALLVGVLALALFTMHGALWLALKTEGELRARMRTIAQGVWFAFALLFLLATVSTFAAAPHLFQGVSTRPPFWFVLPLFAIAAVVIPIANRRGWGGPAFLASAAAIACMMALSGISLYPRLVPSSIAPANSLTIYNASSSQLTLGVMLIIALVGMPIVIAYTAFIYRVFRGAAQTSGEHY